MPRYCSGAIRLTSVSPSTMSSTAKAFFDVYIGDHAVHDEAQAEYDKTCALLSKNHAIYGLPSVVEELSEEQQQILAELDVHPSPLRLLSMLS